MRKWVARLFGWGGDIMVVLAVYGLWAGYSDTQVLGALVSHLMMDKARRDVLEGW